MPCDAMAWWRSRSVMRSLRHQAPPWHSTSAGNGPSPRGLNTRASSGLSPWRRYSTSSTSNSCGFVSRSLASRIAVVMAATRSRDRASPIIAHGAADDNPSRSQCSQFQCNAPSSDRRVRQRPRRHNYARQHHRNPLARRRRVRLIVGRPGPRGARRSAGCVSRRAVAHAERGRAHLSPSVLHGYMMRWNVKAFDQEKREFSMARALAILDGLRDESDRQKLRQAS